MTSTAPKSNLPAGAGAALAGALVGAVVWAVIASATNYKIGIVAVGVGAIAGFLAGRVGGVHPAPLPVVAAVIGLIGCVVGDVLISAHAVADFSDVSTTTVLKEMLKHPSEFGWPIYKAGFEGFDLIFYAIAAYAAFRLAQQIGAQTAAQTASAAAPLSSGTWDAPPADTSPADGDPSSPESEPRRTG